MLLEIYNRSYANGRLPDTWKQQDLIPISKHGDMGNPRPISLISCVGKTMERMLLPRLVFQNGPFPPYIYAFRKGVGTQDCITDLLAHIGRGPAAAVFLDLDKAYERADPLAILSSLVHRGVTGNALQWIRDFLHHRTASVRFKGTTSEERVFLGGTPQGSTLSPFLFNILMQELLQVPLHETVKFFCYADDLAVVAVGANRLANITAALNALGTKAQQLGLLISPTKSRAVSFRGPQPQQPLRMGNTAIPWVETHRYLGVILDNRLSFDKEVEYLRERAADRTRPLKYMAGLRMGANQDVMRRYYIAAVRSLVDYAAPTLVNLTDRQRSKLEVLQNNALRPILGAPIWAKTHNLRMEAGCPSLDTRVSIRICNIAARALAGGRPSVFAATLRTNLRHPGRRQGVYYYANKVAGHLRRAGAVHVALRVTPDVPPPDTIPTPPWEPNSLRFAEVLLPRPKHQCSDSEITAAIAEHLAGQEYRDSEHIYTDGSVAPDGMTAGAAVVRGETGAAWSLPTPCSSTMAELAAIRQAMEEASRCTKERVVIFTDSMAALAALRNRAPKNHTALVLTIQAKVRHLQTTGRTVQLTWIPGHANIAGNVRADALARNATLSPHVSLRLPLQRSVVAGLVTRYGDRMVEEEHRRWLALNSQSASWYQAATKRRKTPVTAHTPRRLATVASRLCLGYPCSWEILEGRTRECQHCGQETQEGLLHYLLDCQHTATLRRGASVDVTQSRMLQAAAIVFHVTEELEEHSDVLTEFPPPR